ncbi:efflux RND transporter periplasmic adaptor subunit [Guyparkeria hydrothermalis]|uniref:efflux RND transporter periplasmic adaptor subunit n=1 Tax=Guyparkeria TaxID=2035712 RepID=UPI0010AC11E8|nr:MULTISPECIES: efflux RND transporter periplasmic adaptor subunit [Guyparkeria]MCL7751751.1 efflux RND transporter periplasmic adaptor subunit [Guyparkeria hydrothermalis]TKA91249.1 efflux RND transporter periplasmic adaptor subunit [Guyparkeria sp. SB14A]
MTGIPMNPSQRVSLVPRTLLAAVFLSLPLVVTAVDAAEPPRVVTESAAPTEIIEVVELDGTVRSLRTAALSVEIAGLVAAVLVETGDRVTAGTPLFELDSELERLAVASLEAERRQALAARREAVRRLDEARSVGAGRNIAETEVQARASAVEQAEARLAAVSATLERGQARLDRHRLVAPFDGVVTERLAERGEWVVPGEALIHLVDRDTLRLDFPVPQRYFPLVGEQAELRFRLDGTGMDWQAAGIATVVPVADATSRTFLVRGEPSGDVSVLPGMAVEGRLRLATGRDGLTVARDAVQRYPDGRTTVWVLDEGEGQTVTERQIELADGFDDRVVITAGIEAGDRVIVRGNEALERGMEVRVGPLENEESR